MTVRGHLNQTADSWEPKLKRLLAGVNQTLQAWRKSCWDNRPNLHCSAAEQLQCNALVQLQCKGQVLNLEAYGVLSAALKNLVRTGRIWSFKSGFQEWTHVSILKQVSKNSVDPLLEESGSNQKALVISIQGAKSELTDSGGPETVTWTSEDMAVIDWPIRASSSISIVKFSTDETTTRPVSTCWISSVVGRSWTSNLVVGEQVLWPLGYRTICRERRLR